MGAFTVKHTTFSFKLERKQNKKKSTMHFSQHCEIYATENETKMFQVYVV